MPCLPKKYKDVRNAVAHLLRHPSRSGILYSAEKLAELLNAAIGSSIGGDIPLRFDPHEILADPIISKNKDLWLKMAAAEKTVDLFDTKTWGGEDYSILVDVVHEMIVPHMAQNQRIESHVQMHAVVARTDVKEVRRSARGTLHSTIMRPFNHESREAKREKASKKSKAEKENIKRVKDKERVAGFTTFVTKLNQRIDTDVAKVGDDVYKSVLQDMKTDKERTSSSADELNQAIAMYDQGMKKARKKTKSETNEGGITVTAQMSGKILLSILLKSKDHDAHVNGKFVVFPQQYNATPNDKRETYTRARTEIVSPGKVLVVAPKRAQKQNSPDGKDHQAKMPSPGSGWRPKLVAGTGGQQNRLSLGYEREGRKGNTRGSSRQWSDVLE